MLFFALYDMYRENFKNIEKIFVKSIDIEREFVYYISRTVVRGGDTYVKKIIFEKPN